MWSANSSNGTKQTQNNDRSSQRAKRTPPKSRIDSTHFIASTLNRLSEIGSYRAFRQQTWSTTLKLTSSPIGMGRNTILVCLLVLVITGTTAGESKRILLIYPKVLIRAKTLGDSALQKLTLAATGTVIGSIGAYGTAGGCCPLFSITQAQNLVNEVFAMSSCVAVFQENR